MPLYKLTAASGKVSILDAVDLATAKSTYITAYGDQETLIGDKELSDVEYSQLTSSGGFSVWDQFGIEHYISGNYVDLPTKLNTITSGAKSKLTTLLTGDFSLIGIAGGGGGGGGGGAPDTSENPVGPNTHFMSGSGNSDYPNTTFARTNAINLIKKLNWNSSRNDVGLSNTGVPSNAGADAWVDACYANHISVMLVISVTSASNTVPDTSSNAAIQAQYVSQYNSGYSKGNGVATRYGVKVKYYNIGSETDVLDAQLKARDGFGCVEVAAPTGAGTSASPYRWADTYRGATLVWDNSRHGLVFYYIKGLIDGIKAANAAAEFNFNYASNHSGRCVRWCTDIKTLNLQGVGAGPLKMNTMGNDWYSREEFGSDTSGYLYPSGTKNAGTLYNRMKTLFLDKGLCDKVYITECGLVNKTRAASVSGYSSTGAFLKNNTFAQYWSKVDGIFPYEAFNELISRPPTGTSPNLDYSEQSYGLQTGPNDVLTTPDESVQDWGSYNPFPKPPA